MQVQSLKQLCKNKVRQLLSDRQYQYINLNLIAHDILTELCAIPKYHLWNDGDHDIFIESDKPYDELALYWARHPRYMRFFSHECFGCMECRLYPEYCKCDKKCKPFEKATDEDVIGNMRTVLKPINFVSTYKVHKG